MTALWQWLMQASLMLCLLIPLACLMSAALRRYCSARLAYAAWLLPLLALLPPTWLPASPVELPGLSVTAAGIAESLAPAETAAVATLAAQADLLLSFWLAVALFLMIAAGWSQIRFNRELARGQGGIDQVRFVSGWPSWAPVYRSRTCPGAMIVGVAPPRLYLPAGKAAPHPWVLAHERAHLRHGDPFWNLVMLLFRVTFWFHPLVWLSARRVRRDQELAADESVIAGLAADQRLAYGRLLLAASAINAPASTLPWKSTNPIKERVMHIARIQPGTGARLAGTILLVVGVLAAGLVLASSDTGIAPEHHAEPEQSTEPRTLHPPIERVNPRYPRAAAEAGITGSVTLEGRILDDGSVTDIKVVSSTPPGVFDEEAIAAFSQWRFAPTPDDSSPGTLTVRQTIEFELDQ